MYMRLNLHSLTAASVSISELPYHVNRGGFIVIWRRNGIQFCSSLADTLSLHALERMFVVVVGVWFTFSMFGGMRRIVYGRLHRFGDQWLDEEGFAVSFSALRRIAVRLSIESLLAVSLAHARRSAIRWHGDVALRITSILVLQE